MATTETAQEFITSHTGDALSADAEAWVLEEITGRDRLLVRLGLVTVVIGFATVAFGFIFPAASLVLTIVADASLGVAIVSFILLFNHRRKVQRVMRSLIDDQCRPDLFAERYLAYIVAVPPRKILNACINYSRALRWQGRWDDAVGLMEAYVAQDEKDSPDARFQLEQIRAYCAFDRRDIPAMESAVDALDELVPRASGPAKQTAQQLRGFMNLLIGIRDGELEDVHLVCAQLVERCQPIQRSELAILLALSSDTRKEANVWLTFASKNAGSTWCRKAVKRLRDSREIKGLPRG